ncbi:MAG: hypothetical protein K0V04_30410 [Deltaproteobacteria bacterium]|nr:hypothetical protein [Deltaproteobacteria bacterium]
MPPLIIDRPFSSMAALCETLRDHYWQRSPVVFRGHGLGDVLGGTDDVLRGLQALARLGTPARIYAAGRRLGTVQSQWCTSDDASVEGYVQRLCRDSGTGEVLVVTDSFERSDESLWFRAAELLSTLYRTVGFPVGDAQVNVFAGTYSQTPFKFHKDIADSITYALEGHKRYLIWGYDLVAQHLPLPADARHENVLFEHYDYQPLRSLATVLETQPGDIIYWPWDCFHLAEPHGARFSVSISVGVVPFAAPFATVDPVAKCASYAQRTEQFSVGLQPDLVSSHVEAARRSLEDETVLGAVREAALYRRTRFGFKQALPTVASTPFDDDDVLAPPRPDLVSWTPHDNGVLVSVNGHGFHTAEHPGLLALLVRLNEGDPVRVGDLRAASDDDDDSTLDEDELEQLLDCLHQFRAFDRQPATTSVQRARPHLVSEDLFHSAGLFPLRLVDDGTAVLMGEVRDEQHRRIEGFETRAVRVPMAKLAEQYAGRPPLPCRPRYIFTQGYGGSTLLCRCVDAIPGCWSVHEPPVLGDWSLHYGTIADEDGRRRWLEALRLLTALLFRARDPEARVVVKVGPHVQEVMPELLAIDPRATGVHLYTALPRFLANTLKRPERRGEMRDAAWAPQRHRVAALLGTPTINPARLTDARAIAYVWLTDLFLYRGLRARSEAAAVRALDFDRVLDQPAQGVRALAEQLDLGLAAGSEAAIASGGLFERHAKSGLTSIYDQHSREATLTHLFERHRAEIDDALAWARHLWGADLPTVLGDELLPAPDPLRERPAPREANG